MRTAAFGCLYIVVADLQLWSLCHRVSQPNNYFLFSIQSPLPITVFPLSSFQSQFINHNSSICCLYVSIFKPGVPCNTSLDVNHLFLPFSYMFLSFQPSRGGSVNLGRGLIILAPSTPFEYKWFFSRSIQSVHWSLNNRYFRCKSK